MVLTVVLIFCLCNQYTILLTFVYFALADQQNLSAVQIGNEIWYRVIRPIAHAAEFMVYYGEGKSETYRSCFFSIHHVFFFIRMPFLYL